jgi:molybdopterin converting factor subunit 1
MKVEVKLFAVAKQLAGTDAISIELPADATVQELRDALGEQRTELRDIIARSMIAIDAEYVSNDARVPNSVPENSEIALIPPVSGG